MTEPTLVTFNNGTNDGEYFGNYTRSNFKNPTKKNSKNFKNKFKIYREWEYYNLWHTEAQWTIDIGNLTESGVGNQGMLGEITQYVNTSNTDPLAPVTYTPWYSYYSGGADAMMDYLNDQKEYWVQRQLADQKFPRCYTCPQAANIFNTVDIAPNTSSPSSPSIFHF